ncbi:EAL domain-containing protein [Ideonella margarita]|uniref:EAL domain-containing protein n=1 Tax=Ideonella margarita TaxID=2984191 RepID=A0ABU9C6B9_9BURK
MSQVPQNEAPEPRHELWLMAIREGFVALLPLTLLGAAASTLANLPRGADWLTHVLAIDMLAAARTLLNTTTGIMGLMSAMVIAMRVLAIRGDKQDADARNLGSIAAIAGAGFLIAVMPRTGLDFRELGYGRILQGILVGVGTAELFIWSARWMPLHDRLSTFAVLGLPLRPALRMSQFAAMALPLIYVVFELSGWLWQWGVGQFGGPLMALIEAHRPPGTVLDVALALINQLMWVCGLNGGQVLLEFAQHSGNALVAATGETNIGERANPAFVNAFAHLGGAGATWGLIFACLLAARDLPLRQLALASIAPALLNVNELLLFGMPLIFSQLMLLPFVLAPVVNVVVSQALLNLLGLSLDSSTVVWSTPVFISGYAMTGSWWGAGIQLLCMGISTLIYIPHVRRLVDARNARQRAAIKSHLSTLASATDTGSGFLERTDEIGTLSRALVADFRRHLGQNRLTVVYQPQHDIDGQLIGAEALLRWDHPLCGPVPPDVIVRLAEECDLIHQLGASVLEQACADLAAWRRHSSLRFPISVNMSPVQLEDPAWVGIVLASLAKHGLALGDLELEITEGRRVSSSPQADATLAALEREGFHLAMDDFGMGCTSLLYMQRFRIRTIKLDGCLTRDIEHQPVNQDIVRAVAQLGRSRGVTVLAEYVEYPGQRDVLHRLGCHYFQGWLYSRALPHAEFLSYLDRVALKRSGPRSWMPT